ncbi:ABSCISIC ACID-INSENSITIVE 5-like protein 3 [Gossypium hirsutum]|uniref:ABSCISIC ACID-INSENSITIVE 5-like protein 3 n=1 Tax=Gossypium hirsutum TaxID=3635 RepID=A0A1U8N4N5_GOSHI|nr:ABSCISIC ACID-INSENSITIVE 5-like protein 3 [Gossypium hirsutum]
MIYLFTREGGTIYKKPLNRLSRRRGRIRSKNRNSAAKSRARSQERTRFLEEKVEQLRNENAHLKKLLSLEAAAAERLPEEREVMQGKKAKQCLESEELQT